MFRTLLVLLFLAACGVYLHLNPEPASLSKNSPPEMNHTVVDDSSLKKLKELIPAQLFEREVKPALEQNRSEGLSVVQLSQLISRLEAMGRELGGKAAEATEDAAKTLEHALPAASKAKEGNAQQASRFAQKTGEKLKESMPAVKEVSTDILSGMIAVLSQMLAHAADLLKK